MIGDPRGTVMAAAADHHHHHHGPCVLDDVLPHFVVVLLCRIYTRFHPPGFRIRMNPDIVDTDSRNTIVLSKKRVSQPGLRE